MQIVDAFEYRLPTGTHDPNTPLRLSGTPSITPIGWLSLEDVLNAIGRHDHPNIWGQLPGWSDMPFRWHRKERQYIRHELQLIGSRARLRRVPVKLALIKAERQACIQLFKAVRTTLREAFEAGRITAYAAHHGSGMHSAMLAPGVWLMQARPIFYTGCTVIREPGLPDRLADVVIEQGDFDKWMEARRKERAKNASEAILRRAGELIGEHQREHGYGISRADALDLVTGAARQHGREVSERQFKKLVWAPRGAKAGRRTKEQKDQFAQRRVDLSALLGTLFAGSS